MNTKRTATRLTLLLALLLLVLCCASCSSITKPICENTRKVASTIGKASAALGLPGTLLGEVAIGTLLDAFCKAVELFGSTGDALLAAVTPDPKPAAAEGEGSPRAPPER